MKKNYYKLVLILLCLFTIQGYSQSVLFNETFGSGFSLPSGWSFSGSGDVNVDDGSGITPCALSGSSGASSMYGADGSGGLEFATTPSFSTTGKSNITLDFNLRMFDALTPALTVYYSLDNITFTVVGTPTVTAYDVWERATTINLPVGAENQANVYIKFEYLSTGAFSYVAIDDVTVTGPIFYWNGVGALHTLASWGKFTDGSGTAPTSFTATGQTFNIVNNTSATLSGNWTLNGAGTSVIIGDGSSWNVNFTIPSTNTITLTNATTSLICAANSTLTLANTNMPPVAKVFLNAASTVDYAQSSSVNILNLAYNNLSISGGASKTINSNLTITGVLNLTNNIRLSGSFLQTLNLNGTITGAGRVETGNSSLVINGTGAFGTITFTTGTTASTVRTFSVNRTSTGTLLLGSNLTVTGGTLALVNGTLDLNGNALTSNSVTSITSGFIKGSTTSSLTIGGGGVQAISGSLNMDQTSSTTRSLYDLTLNRSGQTLTIGNALEIRNSVVPTLGTIASGGNITLKSTSALKARIGVVGGSLTGNITVETFALGGSTGWTNLGVSGVTGKRISDWDGQIPMSCVGCTNDEMSAGGRFVSVQGWNEAASGGAEYVELTGSSNLNPGIGYWVYLGDGFSSTSDIIYTVTGPAVTGGTVIPLTNSAQAGFNLVANPYASPISWDAVQALPANSSFASPTYIWNPDLSGGAGATVSYNAGVTTPMSGGSGVNIPMGQGFYVDAGALANLTFAESVKSTGNTAQLLKSASSPTIGDVFRLTVASANGDNDETVIRFHSGATNSYDSHLDARKIFKSPGYLGYPGVYSNYTTISTRLTGIDYSINSIQYSSKDMVIPVLVKVVASGVYTISPIDIGNVYTSCVMLKDKLLGVEHDLMTGPYVCILSDTATVPRFDLKVCASAASPAPTGIKQATAQNVVLINQDQNGAYVKTIFENTTKATISAYNTMGQKLMADMEVEGKDMTTYLNLGDLHSQVVIIRVTTAQENITKKLFVN